MKEKITKVLYLELEKRNCTIATHEALDKLVESYKRKGFRVLTARLEKITTDENCRILGSTTFGYNGRVK